MEREIKFRGKRANGIWKVNKSITQRLSGKILLGGYAVNPYTIGQFTGLKDAKGKDIYEGDILHTDLERDYLIVVFRNGAFMFDCFDEKHYYDFMTYAEDDSGIINLSIIGNIYDNKELLKGE